MKIGFDPYITFQEDGHKYFDTEGNNYSSVSNVIKTFKTPFDGQKISYNMAGGDKNEQDKLLKEWDKKRVDASNYGTVIHRELENYFLSGVVHPSLKETADDIRAIIQPHKLVMPEKIFYSKGHRVAGTADLPVLKRSVRIAGKNFDVLDIGDYKTNTANGIRYSSTYMKNGEWKFGNRMLDVCSHLDECEYNSYMIQLSIYGYMAEMTYDVLIGSLFILQILPNGFVNYIHVPYNKLLAKAILDRYVELKKM